MKVNLENFIKEAEELYKKLNIEEKNCLITFADSKLNPISHSYSFQPCISEKSRKIAQRLNGTRSNIANRERNNQIASRMKLNQEKRKKVNEELSRCTFQPNKISKRHGKSFCFY